MWYTYIVYSGDLDIEIMSVDMMYIKFFFVIQYVFEFEYTCIYFIFIDTKNVAADIGQLKKRQ